MYRSASASAPAPAPSVVPVPVPVRIPVLWPRWIEFLCLLLIVYGLAMAFAPQMMNSTLVGPLLYHTEALRTAFSRVTEPELTFLNVMNGLLGAVTVGYGIPMGWIAFEPFRKGEAWAWNAIAMSVIAWAALEGYVKLANGLGVWSLAHTGLLVAFGIPLLATYRYFHPSAVIAPKGTINSEQ